MVIWFIISLFRYASFLYLDLIRLTEDKKIIYIYIYEILPKLKTTKRLPKKTTMITKNSSIA